MISLKATKSLNLIKSDANKYAKFTKTHLVRVYPRGRKVLSGNYDPIPHWNTGAQLVALNYQTYDTPMIFNKALFALNGKCGYVLKPKYLRKGMLYGTSDMKPKQVKMTIISGQHIPKHGNTFEGKIIDPYVKLRVYGHSADWYEFTTNVVKNNGMTYGMKMNKT
jgi:phosphatidylinositol phospholipase C delta